jgi:hypothetical protein
MYILLLHATAVACYYCCYLRTTYLLLSVATVVSFELVKHAVANAVSWYNAVHSRWCALLPYNPMVFVLTE